MRAVILGLAALVACQAASLGVLSAADGIPVTIAVLRRDGVLIPIATRTGSKWAHTWPVPTKTPDVPLGLDSVPKRWWGKPGPTTTWHAWTIDAGPKEIRVERPTWYLAHCQQGVGLLTSIAAPEHVPPPTVQPYPKRGLASSAPLTFRAVEPLDEGFPLWQAIRASVATALETAEKSMTPARLVMNVGPMAVHPIAPAERAKVQTRLESLYRVPLSRDRFLYYFEASKRYKMPALAADQKSPAPSTRPDGCSLLSFAQGWLVVGPDGKPPIPTIDEVRLASCEYDGVQLMLPLGYVRDTDGPLWIAELAGWENESYFVFRWDEEKKKPVPVFQTHGGWCE